MVCHTSLACWLTGSKLIPFLRSAILMGRQKETECPTNLRGYYDRFARSAVATASVKR